MSDEVIRVYVGADRSQMVGVKVLEYSIKKHTTRPVKLFPMLDLNLPEPKDKRQLQRTGFSFSRFAIPKLAGYQGKAIYMDADMQVFKDIGLLWDIPFDDAKMLIQNDLPEERKATKEITGRKRVKQCAVSLLDCSRLTWKADEIIKGLDGSYNYSELMHDLCILKPNEIGYKIPFEWNSLEYWDENTCNIHYTDMQTQPWASNVNPFGWVWVNELKEMLNNGAIEWLELEQEVKLGYARPSLLVELKLDEDLAQPSTQRNNRLNTIDKEAGFIKHKEVYENKKRRLQAEKDWIMNQKNSGLKNKLFSIAANWLEETTLKKKRIKNSNL